MCGLIHYGNGSAPIFYDSGYIPFKPFWLLGLFFCVFFVGVYAITGPLWWKMLGYL